MVIIKSSKYSFKQMEFPVFRWIRHHVFTAFDVRMRNVKCKNKNVLEVLKSSKYISASLVSAFTISQKPYKCL